jgi:hypothetical protein
VGSAVGDEVGIGVGVGVGAGVGEGVGTGVGDEVGVGVGEEVDATVGDGVGVGVAIFSHTVPLRESCVPEGHSKTTLIYTIADASFPFPSDIVYVKEVDPKKFTLGKKTKPSLGTTTLFLFVVGVYDKVTLPPSAGCVYVIIVRVSFLSGAKESFSSTLQ